MKIFKKTFFVKPAEFLRKVSTTFEDIDQHWSCGRLRFSVSLPNMNAAYRHAPLTSHMPLPFCCFDRTDVWGLVYQWKSVSQWFINLLWMWILRLFDSYCNNDNNDDCLLGFLDSFMPWMRIPFLCVCMCVWWGFPGIYIFQEVEYGNRTNT